MSGLSLFFFFFLGCTVVNYLVDVRLAGRPGFATDECDLRWMDGPCAISSRPSLATNRGREVVVHEKNDANDML